MSGRERIVVSNSGPIIALSGVGRLDLLKAVYGSVEVPLAVFREVVAGGGRPGAADLQAAAWIVRADLSQRPDPYLIAELGPGEAEAIALAAERPGTLVLLDERRARRIAQLAYGLKVRGTLGTLVAAKRIRAVEAIRPLLKAMQRNGYYLADELVERVCREVGE